MKPPFLYNRYFVTLHCVCMVPRHTFYVATRCHGKNDSPPSHKMFGSPKYNTNKLHREIDSPTWPPKTLPNQCIEQIQTMVFDTIIHGSDTDHDFWPKTWFNQKKNFDPTLGTNRTWAMSNGTWLNLDQNSVRHASLAFCKNKVQLCISRVWTLVVDSTFTPT